MGMIRLLSLMLIIGAMLGVMMPAQGQDQPAFEWPAALNPGEMPANPDMLPPISAMPRLNLPEPLIPGTLFFNFESYGERYTIMNLTLDNRLYAYNITYDYGVHPVSPSGQYGIYTVPDGALEVITCGILDLLTGTTVDRFETLGGCNQTNVHWSPDSTRILFQTRDEAGHSALGIRANGETTVLRPAPVDGVDLGGETLTEDRQYRALGWVGNEVVSFELGLGPSSSEQLYASLEMPADARPATALTVEETGQRFILSFPAQPAIMFNRGVWLTDLVTGEHRSLAPAFHVATQAVLAPDESAIVYWAETEGPLGTTHPLRLTMYIPATESQVVLLQFEGPTDSLLKTRPGHLVWNPEGIYFFISQQSGALSPLLTGTYRIQPDGSNLEWVTGVLLWSSLPH